MARAEAGSDRTAFLVVFVLCIVGILAIPAWRGLDHAEGPMAEAPPWSPGVVVLAAEDGPAGSRSTRSDEDEAGNGCTEANHDAEERAVLAALASGWPSLEKQIPFRPSFHDLDFPKTWPPPIEVQFIGGGALLVEFEDDDTANAAVMKRDEDGFRFLQSFRGKPAFSPVEWEGLVRKYGDSHRVVSTYTKSVIRNRQIVNFTKLTKVPENVFLEDD